MKNLSKEFVGRTIRALLFIGLVVILCTAVSSAGLFLASRFGLTKSREQVPLTALSIEGEGSVELPQRGKMVEGEGWRLRNSRDIYTLTLDNAMIGDGSGQPAISITGDLIMELKKDSGSWINSGGNGIQIEAGTLVIRGAGSLKIDDIPGSVHAAHAFPYRGNQRRRIKTAHAVGHASAQRRKFTRLPPPHQIQTHNLLLQLHSLFQHIIDHLRIGLHPS